MTIYMIERIDNSPRRNSRYRVILTDKRYYDFGLRGAQTYIDHKDITKRENYRKRHLANPLEKKLIESYTPSPALFAYYLLWGESTDLGKNVEWLNKKL